MLQADSSGQTELTASRSSPGMRCMQSYPTSLGNTLQRSAQPQNCRYLFFSQQKIITNVKLGENY